jgi:hypothetical protein
VIAHRDFVDEMAPMLHDVWDFASPEAAAQAIEVIDTDLFRRCFFDFFDRTTARGTRVVGTSVSTEWAAPEIPAHGDRQITFGQTIDYTIAYNGATIRLIPHAINGFVQVGRAIGFVDMAYMDDVGPGSNVEKALTLVTENLEKVFGQA